MTISAFDLFSIGIGPSSSHTMGPMRAAKKFVDFLSRRHLLNNTYQIKAELYGSLALTGKGHGTDRAILLGLEGHTPEGVNPDSVEGIIHNIRHHQTLQLPGTHSISFNEEKHLIFHYDEVLPFHPNGMRFTAKDAEGKVLASKVYYSIGGGFIVEEEKVDPESPIGDHAHAIPYPFHTAEELLLHCKNQNKTIEQIVMDNERTWRTDAEIDEGLFRIWDVMQRCVERGCRSEGILPGGLNVRRRAANLYKNLNQQPNQGKNEPDSVMKWVSVWALAVNEESAAGGRVVTAPTNGAAGIIPAVLHYYVNFTPSPTKEGIRTFFLTAGAIGILYKLGASISAAEMGCMGEVGVACSMAAGGLTAALGGSVLQVENAAEIGMEHNLGLTCDPVMGLVQIPCIERNTMGAIKAINAMILALEGDGQHRVSLDQVINTMRQTGTDMKTIYKETSLGGLAVNVPEC